MDEDEAVPPSWVLHKADRRSSKRGSRCERRRVIYFSLTITWPKALKSVEPRPFEPLLLVLLSQGYPQNILRDNRKRSNVVFIECCQIRTIIGIIILYFTVLSIPFLPGLYRQCFSSYLELILLLGLMKLSNAFCDCLKTTFCLPSLVSKYAFIALHLLKYVTISLFPSN